MNIKQQAIVKVVMGVGYGILSKVGKLISLWLNRYLVKYDIWSQQAIVSF